MANNDSIRTCPKCGMNLGQRHLCPVCDKTETEPEQPQGGRTCPKCGMNLGQKHLCPVCDKTESRSERSGSKGTKNVSFDNDAFLKRILGMMSRKDWKNARSLCAQALNAEPNNAEVYFLLCMIDFEASSEADLWRANRRLPDNSNFKTALKLASEELKGRLQQIVFSSLVEVVIPAGVTEIEANAFKNCTSLTSVTMPDSVTIIGNGAFSGCIGLTSVKMSNKLRKIGENAFYDCTSLASITIPNSVTTIGKNAFSGCIGLTSIAIPKNAIRIGRGAFWRCVGIQQVTVPYILARRLYEFIDKGSTPSLVISPGINRINHNAFEDCTWLTSITIPYGVTKIESNAFHNCINLTSITIPNSVTEIGFHAFDSCIALRSIVIPDSVTKIEIDTFFGCTSLTSVTLPSSFVSRTLPGGIPPGMWLFSNSGAMFSLVISRGGSGIPCRAFYNCANLVSVEIPDGVTTIGDAAFQNCIGLTSVRLPNSLTHIGNCAFRGCARLTSVTLPENVITIGSEAFSGCGLSSVVIPESVENLGFNAFNCQTSQGYSTDTTSESGGADENANTNRTASSQSGADPSGRSCMFVILLFFSFVMIIALCLGAWNRLFA